MLGDVIIRLFALRRVQPPYKKQLLPFGSRSELVFESSWIIGIGNDGSAESPANTSIEEFEANPPLRKIRIGLSVAVKVCEVMKRRILKIKANTARGSNESTIHSRSLLISENCRVCAFTLNIH